MNYSIYKKFVFNVLNYVTRTDFFLIKGQLSVFRLINRGMNNNISFTSAIRPASLTEFTRLSEPLYNSFFVRYPWTAKETLVAEKAFTMDIYDCTAGGIVDRNSKKVVLFHICPEMSINKYFDAVEQIIMGKIEGFHENLRAFLIGSNKMFKDSMDNYENLKRMILRKNISLSELRGSREKAHILYDSVNDEWIVSSSGINSRIMQGESSERVLNGCFDTVLINAGDTII